MGFLELASPYVVRCISVSLKQCKFFFDYFHYSCLNITSTVILAGFTKKQNSLTTKFKIMKHKLAIKTLKLYYRHLANYHNFAAKFPIKENFFKFFFHRRSWDVINIMRESIFKRQICIILSHFPIRIIFSFKNHKINNKLTIFFCCCYKLNFFIMK